MEIDSCAVITKQVRFSETICLELELQLRMKMLHHVRR